MSGATRVSAHLDRHVAIQLRIARAIHLAHAAGAEQRGTEASLERLPIRGSH